MRFWFFNVLVESIEIIKCHRNFVDIRFKNIPAVEFKKKIFIGQKKSNELNINNENLMFHDN